MTDPSIHDTAARTAPAPTDAVADAKQNVLNAIEAIDLNSHQAAKMHMHKAVRNLTYAAEFMAVKQRHLADMQDPQVTLDAVRENARRLAEAKAAGKEWLTHEEMFGAAKAAPPREAHPVEKLWREIGLAEWFLGNGGTNTKLYALYDAILALAPPAVDRAAAIEAAARQVVTDYPAAAGTLRAYQPKDGYGSIRALRIALADTEGDGK
jgi:hypothetical protein